MGHSQKLNWLSFLCVSFLVVLPASADWRGVAARSGFFGKYSLSGNYSPSENHEFELGIGSYSIGATYYGQLNAAYRYGYWHVPWQEKRWTPQAGVFTIYSLDQKHFFTESPGKYPSPNYYDQTSYRWGLEFGFTLAFLSTGLDAGYRFRILDTGVIAFYNNGHRDLQYYCSSALELRYNFQ